MPKSPDQYIEQTTRHAAHVERLKSQEVKVVRDLYADMEDQILGKLSKQNVGAWTRKRMNSQLSGVRKIMRTKFDDDIIPAINKSIRDLATYEAEFEMKSLGKVADFNFEMPAQDQILSAIRTKPLSMRGPDGGKLLTSFMKDWTESQVSRTANTIRSGFAMGQTTPQLIARLRDEVGPINRRGLEALTRTSLQHCAVQAREQVWERNKDIVKKVKWLSTLDSRTSAQCQALSGQTFDIDSGPRPPAHPNCRSTVIAELDERFKLLDEGGTQRTRDPATGKVGYTDADETYYGWLSRQPAQVQDSIIGPTRGKLLREGGLSSQRFAELQLNKNFKPITLEEMRKLEPVAFERAGLADSKTPAFAPARTIKEAEDWAAKGVASESVSFKGADLDVANQFNDAMNEMIVKPGRQPLKHVSVNTVEDIYKNAFASAGDNVILIRQAGVTSKTIAQEKSAFAGQVSRKARIVQKRKKRIQEMVSYHRISDPQINAKKYPDLMKEIKKLRQIATSPPNYTVTNNMKEVFIHEFGHIAQERYKKQVSSTAFNKNAAFGKILRDEASRPNKISQYAMSDPDEFFAEAWAAYHTGKKKLLTKPVVDMIEDVAGRIK